MRYEKGNVIGERGEVRSQHITLADDLHCSKVGEVCPHRNLSHLIWPCLPYLILSCLVLSCLVLSCLVLSCIVLSCVLLSCLVLSRLLVSSRLVSSRLVSCLGVLLEPFGGLSERSWNRLEAPLGPSFTREDKTRWDKTRRDKTRHDHPRELTIR